MILTRIRIDGFGALKGTDLKFGRGMNLVVGPNEAGKSTLQEALLTGLFGLAGDRQRGRAGADQAERWRPWHGGPFGLALEIELDDRTRLIIERDLEAGLVQVLDAASGQDITSRFDLDSGAGVPVGRQLLGITREIYANTACISRSEVLRLEDAGSIKEAIMSLADSAQPDRTAQAVLDRLRQQRAERIGRPRARSGPLRDLETRLAQLERELATARQARAAVDDLATKRETVAALTDAELGIVRILEAALLRARLEDARRRLERATELERIIAEEEQRQRAHAAFAAFPVDRHPDVQDLRSHLRAAREAQADFEQRAATVQDQVDELERERERMRAEAANLEAHSRGIDELALKEEPLVREIVSSLTFADWMARSCSSRGAYALRLYSRS